ncbi:MAG: heme biosynthesis HemY N-terminal domain-containing protein [Elstera sp.]
MRALLFLLLKLAVLVAGFVWLANHPGTVRIAWEGWQIDTTPALLIGGSFGLALLFYGLIWLFTTLRAGPRAWARARRWKQREAGIEALTGGLLALAAGDASTAKRALKPLYQGLGDRPVALLLTAQTALLEQDFETARKAFTDLTEQPRAAFLGWRGLVSVERAAGNPEAALIAARQAQALRPNAPAILHARLDLTAQRGDWADYRQALELGGDALPAPERHHRQAVAALAEAQAHEAAGNPGAALVAVDDALTAEKEFEPALLAKARLLQAEGRGEEARAWAEKQWRKHPHPDFLPFLLTATDALGRYRQAEKLLRAANHHPEAELALGRAAFDARLWGEARRHFEQARPSPITERRALLALADLAEAEHQNHAQALQFRAEAQSAAPNPGWRCSACGTPAPAWEPVCPACAQVGMSQWGAGSPAVSSSQPAAPTLATALLQ